MRRECRERFPRHRLQRKPLVNDPGMHHGTCVTQVPWCMSVLLTRDGKEYVPGFPGAFATRDFTYLVRGPLHGLIMRHPHRSFRICNTITSARKVWILRKRVCIIVPHGFPTWNILLPKYFISDLLTKMVYSEFRYQCPKTGLFIWNDQCCSNVITINTVMSYVHELWYRFFQNYM